MLMECVTWRDPVRLTPYSGVQLLDYEFKFADMGRLKREWMERQHLEDRRDGQAPRRLHLLTDEDDPERERPGAPRAEPGDSVYEINAGKALETFVNVWMPVPYFRVRPGRDANLRTFLDKGPTNWARVKVVRVSGADEADARYRAIFAFDTALVPARPNVPYTGPSESDSEQEQMFAFAWRLADNAWFLDDEQAGPDGAMVNAQDWVAQWIDQQYRAYLIAKRQGRPPREEDFENRLEPWARYLTFLQALQKAVEPAPVRLTDVVSEAPALKPVMVDFVLDIGNSRTCGMLIESYPNEQSVDLTQSFTLPLRDISNPIHTYDEPFDSRVELSQADFGRNDLSRRSRRANAFLWPSILRVGPEAQRLREQSAGAEMITGMSSPKRYLWDVTPVSQEWRFQRGDYAADGSSGPPIDAAIRRHVNRAGDVLAQIQHETKGRPPKGTDLAPADRLSFSRSSLFGFMAAEIIAQALMAINDPRVRSRRPRSEAPRRLRQLILTLPPAMPVEEQRIMRSRVEGAVRLIWNLQDWTPQGPDDRRRGLPTPPRLEMQWDEASCSQLVYLYGEISQKFAGSPTGLFKLLGRARTPEDRGAPIPNRAPEPSLRIASVDVGGGTTDLMITTYHALADQAISPSQNFREGFRIAGDDVLKAVMQSAVMPALRRALEQAGFSGARDFLQRRFGGNFAGLAEHERQIRRQLVIHALQPLALAVLALYEETDPVDVGREISVRAQDVLKRADAQDETLRLIDRHLVQPAREAGAASFDFADVVITVDSGLLRDCVRETLTTVADQLSELIHEFDCDLVILAGRPARLPAMKELFQERLAVAPDRVISLHQYPAGVWYPFRSRDNMRIDDPKTTVVVGGMLLALAQRQLQNFTVMSNKLFMRSTARYIGQMQNNNQILDNRLLFRDLDMDAKANGPVEADIEFWAPLRLGFRQLNLERWTASPLYRLEMRDPPADWRRPVTVKLERFEVDDLSGEDFDDPRMLEQIRRAEAAKEKFRVAEAQDQQGKNFKLYMALTLDTLGEQDGYWTDTGVLTIS